jgi:DNA-binding ferritin-like protein (Dps family)
MGWSIESIVREYIQSVKEDMEYLAREKGKEYAEEKILKWIINFQKSVGYDWKVIIDVLRGEDLNSLAEKVIQHLTSVGISLD